MNEQQAERIAQALEGIEVALTAIAGARPPGRLIDDESLDYDLDDARRGVARRRSRHGR